MIDDPNMPLSHSGQARRREILRLAVREAAHRRFRRRLTRGAMVTSLIALAFIFRPNRFSPPSMQSAINSATKSAGKSNIQTDVNQPMAAPSAPREIYITDVPDDPNILARLSVPSRPPVSKYLNDDQLLQILSDNHLHGGIVVVNGQSKLILLSSSLRGTN